MTTALPRPARAIGLAGIVSTLLLFVTIGIGGPGEPPLRATTSQAATYLRELDRPWVWADRTLTDVTMMVLLAAMLGIALVLRRLEGEVPVRSTTAMATAVLFAAYVVLDPSIEAAARRAGDLDRGQLAYAYDASTFGFTHTWVVLGAFAVACGAVMIGSPVFARWLGWFGVVAGIALALARFAWTHEGIWILGYAAFWLWLLATCVVFVRRPVAVGRPAEGR